MPLLPTNLTPDLEGEVAFPDFFRGAMDQYEAEEKCDSLTAFKFGCMVDQYTCVEVLEQNLPLFIVYRDSSGSSWHSPVIQVASGTDNFFYVNYNRRGAPRFFCVYVHLHQNEFGEMITDVFPWWYLFGNGPLSKSIFLETIKALFLVSLAVRNSLTHRIKCPLQTAKRSVQLERRPNGSARRFSRHVQTTNVGADNLPRQIDQTEVLHPGYEWCRRSVEQKCVQRSRIVRDFVFFSMKFAKQSTGLAGCYSQLPFFICEAFHLQDDKFYKICFDADFDWKTVVVSK
uniref:Uncharacterized protein n=1 Tax=Bursaphelenchus xylophilus TaxID=6326 RepID=A0A1I7S6J4_BURXY